MQNKTYHLISLGCAKNTVDSESIGTLLQQEGYLPVAKPDRAALIIVNTCGFIHAARQESIQVLKDLASGKKKGQNLIAAGCLPERIRMSLVEQVPGIDGIIGSRRWMDIMDLVRKLASQRPYNKTLYHLPATSTVGLDEHNVMRAAVQGGSAYLKIADGCRRQCAFCSIPLIKGTTTSRPPNVIINEAKSLQNIGIKELILIAQDTTDYGYDIKYKGGLASLLEGILKEAPQIPWVRIMYAYPGYVTDKLIEVMASNPQVLHYLDIPLQHAHPDTLRRMQRPDDMEWVYRTLEKMKQMLPDLSLRTTFIVGYPGETEKEFTCLLDFISEMKFNHVGAFTFSFEQGTASEVLGDPIPEEVKLERQERLMLLQENISLAHNQALIGKIIPTLVEGQNQGISIGRTYRDAPEIDGLVIIEGTVTVGEIVPVQITGALVHDLIGKPASDSQLKHLEAKGK